MTYNIAEEDMCCINCKHDHGMDRDNPAEPCKECCNGWNGEKYDENHFEPDEDYILSEIADCCNCKHQEDVSVCSGCERLRRVDNWEPED